MLFNVLLKIGQEGFVAHGLSSCHGRFFFPIRATLAGEMSRAPGHRLFTNQAIIVCKPETKSLLPPFVNGPAFRGIGKEGRGEIL